MDKWKILLLSTFLITPPSVSASDALTELIKEYASCVSKERSKFSGQKGDERSATLSKCQSLRAGVMAATPNEDEKIMNNQLGSIENRALLEGAK